MPSKLPIIKANTTQENIDKMKVIAGSNKRSVAKELEWLIERHIKEYESENGEIKLAPTTEEITNIMSDKSIPTLERFKKTFQAGVKMGKYGDINTDSDQENAIEESKTED